ncbi:MAG: DUF2183 domain-containing protein [Bernardetiaceae bacterium]|nr:DUF2183 domain-containing protein [Bernardetiaceae bacterium]
MNWRKKLSELSSSAEEKFDSLKDGLKDRLKLKDDVMILPYRTYAGKDKFSIKGRVIEDKGAKSTADDKDSVWDNLLNTYKRIDSDPLSNVLINATWQGETLKTFTNEQGYFEFEFALKADSAGDAIWQSIDFELPTFKSESNKEMSITAKGEVMIPPASFDFGVISDMDDTIFPSKAENLLKAAQITFLKDAKARMPFEGVSAFYQALQAGKLKQSQNPFFYTSSNLWDLYDLFNEFINMHELPKAPLLLRTEEGRQQAKNHYATFKYQQVEKVLDAYPDKPFILIGDSKQKDPEIYFKAALKYQKRILAIYIRDVSSEERDAEVEALCKEAESSGIEMVFVKDTAAAAQHAAQKGFIHLEALPEVTKQKEADQKAENLNDA